MGLCTQHPALQSPKHTKLATLPPTTSGTRIAAPEPTMDLHGQQLAEWLMVRILIAFAAVSFVVGYATASFATMVQINAAGLALTALLVLPDWPFYKKHPLPWLPALNPEATGDKSKDK